MDKQHEYRVATGSGAGLALLGIFLPYAWHDMPTLISYPAILMGVVLVLWGLWPAFSKKRTSNPKMDSPAAVEFISMKEAATSLYTKARQSNTLLATAAERLSGNKLSDGSPNDILNYLATHIARKIPLYGKKPPASTFEVIDPNVVKRSYFDDGAVFLRDNMYDRSIYFIDLAVKSADMTRLLAAQIDEVISNEGGV